MYNMQANSFFNIPASLNFDASLMMLALLSIALILTCVMMIFARTHIRSVILLSFFSLLVSLIYLLNDAPDVAMTEVALGACLSTAVLLNIVAVAGNSQELTSQKKLFFSALICLILLIYIVYFASNIAPFGLEDTPLAKHLSKFYIENTYNDIGIPSMVAAILASYRGFDTFGETTVILIAAIGAMMIINNKKGK